MVDKIFGIDISTYQNGINLANAKNEGVKFVIIRAGFTGSSTKSKNIDDRFIEHYNNALNNNLGIGAYYFSRATSYNEGKDEAEFLYNNILIDKKFDYPIYIDVEDAVYQQKAGKNKVTEAIKGFMEYLEDKGFYVGVYCNLNWANNYMNYDELIKKYDFWLAYWGNEMPKKDKYGNYGMWQFGGETNLLRSNRISNLVCDQNYAFKDYPTIIKNNNLNNYKKEVIIDDNKEIENENVLENEEVNNETEKKSLISLLKKLVQMVIDIIKKYILK